MVLPFPPFFTTYFWVLKLSLPVGWDNTGFAFRAVVGEAISIIFCWDLPGKWFSDSWWRKVWEGHGWLCVPTFAPLGCTVNNSCFPWSPGIHGCLSSSCWYLFLANNLSTELSFPCSGMTSSSSEDEKCEKRSYKCNSAHQTSAGHPVSTVTLRRHRNIIKIVQKYYKNRHVNKGEVARNGGAAVSQSHSWELHKAFFLLFFSCSTGGVKYIY